MRRISVMLPSAVAAGAVIVGLTGPLAHAAPPDASGSCANREAQVVKAEAALERVTAVFQKSKKEVAQADDDVDEADSAQETTEAKKALKAAKVEKDRVTKAKKAQQTRLAKAQQRLADCQPEPEPETDPEPGSLRIIG